ncbi:TetR/AcrR family transcriptional regulator [Staphylococcus cohnii]|uniref:TetR/AcrR family transcriptional regulator n=2 Tax=Staphylococcus cohnii TaxID=29382 RepID=A0ABT6IZ36_9STAP|nr:TetR/AcrR family transcriptional regulator [Staphylococcus cohnii]TGP62436.1 TetR/AcrR family transcriptional regulator [bacterium M00.F.Ca.ET.229.01.1.1]TGS39268.1 TetR/AcrR family transcriptional regulator [bacterium M00.F.Ca.ET.180.01.1.1]AYX90808.1 TetR/AcrR family transcriptional regulator [Staphylococcus cohnii]KKI65374.1 Transcriptional regulator, TetR family [Staphylococcus cohnii subsp. cohnii]MCI2941239.1 TetR/AcrR family transcriptional regulator [Staphylococcus cohnii]
MNRNIKDIMEEIVPKLEHLTEKQRLVIESALILFSEKGYKQTSTSDIAKRAGVAEGTVYKQFKNKEALLYAGLVPIIKDNIAPTVAEEFLSELNRASNLESFINIFVDNRSKFIYENRMLLKVFFNEAMTSKMFQSVLLEVFNKRLVSHLKPIINKMIRCGEMRDVEAEFFVRSLIAQTINLNISCLIGLNYQHDDVYEKHLLFTKESLYYMFTAK